MSIIYFYFFRQWTAYEMRISDWSSDVCSSDLRWQGAHGPAARGGWHARRSSRDHDVAGVPTATARAVAAGPGRRRVASRMHPGSNTCGTPCTGDRRRWSTLRGNDKPAPGAGFWETLAGPVASGLPGRPPADCAHDYSNPQPRTATCRRRGWHNVL